MENNEYKKVKMDSNATYMVRRGKSVNDCAFVLPKNTLKFSKIETIKKMLEKTCEGMDAHQKYDFLKTHCGVSSFKQFHDKTEKQLNHIIRSLTTVLDNN